MTSTRNNNMPGDYVLEQRTNIMINNHNVNQYGRSHRDAHPTQNVNYGSMSRDALSNNPIDIESSLYGISSSNLVNPCNPVNPSLRNLEFKDYFDRPQSVIMQYPHVYNNNERPKLY